MAFVPVERNRGGEAGDESRKRVHDRNGEQSVGQPLIKSSSNYARSLLPPEPLIFCREEASLPPFRFPIRIAERPDGEQRTAAGQRKETSRERKGHTGKLMMTACPAERERERNERAKQSVI